MAKKSVCLLVGHWNIENITSEGLRSWRSASTLSRSTGASGERDYHWNKVMPLLRDKLIAAGAEVYITDAIYNDYIYNREYDLLVALHYDGGGTGERCMAAAPDRATKPDYLNQNAFAESEKFVAVWKRVYPEITGQPYREDLVTQGMTNYYAWDYVGYDTPSVILEHFNHTCAGGTALKNDPEKVAEADFQAIKTYLELEEIIPDDSYKIVHQGEIIAVYETNPEDKIKELTQKLENCGKSLADKTAEVAQLESALAQQEADNADLVSNLNDCKREKDKLVVDNKSLERELQSTQNTLTETEKALESCLNNNKLAVCQYSRWQLWKWGVFGKPEICKEEK